jgi:hypothetical protein
MTAAEKQRIYRKRDSTGGVVTYPVFCPPDLLGRLIDGGYLDVAQSEDKKAVTAALERFALDVAKKVLPGNENHNP